MKVLLSKISEKIKKDPHCYRAYEDLLAICRETQKTDVHLARKYLEQLSDDLEKLIPMSYQQRAVAIMKLFLEEFTS